MNLQGVVVGTPLSEHHIVSRREFLLDGTGRVWRGVVQNVPISAVDHRVLRSTPEEK